MARNTSEAIYIGATIKAAPYGMEFLKAPEASASCTPGGAAAMAQINKKQQERRDAMALPPNMYDRDNPFQRPLTGTLNSIHIHDRGGYSLLSLAAKPNTPPGAIAKTFVNYMLETFPMQFSGFLAHGESQNHTLIFGFGVDEVMRIAAFEIIRANKVDPKHVIDVPVRFWYNPLGVYDPFEIALSASQRKDLNLDSLLRYVGSKYKEAALLYDAEKQALAAFDVVEACNMVPASVSVG